jgi:hypothetical protein
VCASCRLVLRDQPAHVDLAGDGGGDQSGSALLEEGDRSLGFGYSYRMEIFGFSLADDLEIGCQQRPQFIGVAT